MNTQKLKSWLGFFLLSLASFQSMTVLAGAEKGNGADDETYGGTSWFLGQDKVIRYCYISTANFLSM